jgi:hypothetical protein
LSEKANGFAVKLRDNRPALGACLTALASSLCATLPEYGRDLAIDASDLPAYANGQRFVSKNGRSASGTPTPTPPGDTAALSAPGRAVGSTDAVGREGGAGCAVRAKRGETVGYLADRPHQNLRT